MNAFAQKNKTFLIKEYEAGKSTYQIGKELGVNAKRIQRALTSLGVKLRSYKEAQQQALESGRSTHPTKGKKLTEETKNKMGRAISKYWSQMSEEEKLRRSQMSKDQWNAMTEEEKKELYTKAAEGCRKAAKEGSKMEKYVREHLEKLGHNVIYHEKQLIKGSNLEIDIYLPDLNVVIEIDGISHFEPIWGEEAFAKQQRADAVKSGLILSKGFVMLRIKQTCKTVSQVKMTDTLSCILMEIDKIKTKFPEKSKRLIEIEVN
jgi:very-short-patch-repair endonuclease